VQGGQLVEKEVPMLNALNEVLRDDYIKDSVGGVERWNKVIEKAGIPFRLKAPHKAFHRNIGALAGVKVSPDGRDGQRGRMERQRSTSGCPAAKTAPSCQPDGPRGRAGQVRQLDRAAGDGHQPPAGRLRVRALQLIAPANEQGGPIGQGDTHGHGRRGVIKQHLIDPEICIRCNTCEATCPVGAITHDAQLRGRRGQVQPLHGLHRAVPHRQRSTTGAPCRACRPTRVRRSWAGTSCRPS
jgi:ferredoxin